VCVRTYNVRASVRASQYRTLLLSKAAFTPRTTSYVVRRHTTPYVPAHTQPRTQLADVVCVAQPAPEHSQTALLTCESIGGSCHCPAEVLVRVWYIHPCHLVDAARREPRNVEGELVDFHDEKICQKCKDNYQKPKRHRKRYPQSPSCYLYALICINVVRRHTTSDDHDDHVRGRTTSYVSAHPTSYAM